MNITTSEYRTVDVKTRQQIEEEREAYIQQTVMKIQQEALGLKERIKMEENSRIQMIKQEEERLKIEEVKRQEAMQRAEEERKRKELARIEEMRKQQDLLNQKRAEMERQRLEKEAAERKRLEMMKLESQRQQTESVQKTTQVKEETKVFEEAKHFEEMRKRERQKLEELVRKEAKAAASGQVTRRADDPFGQGFGNVKTGYVSSQKLSFLQRAVSLERSDAQSEPKSCSPAPSNSSERKGLRVTWAESPQSSRPSSNLGWTDKVAEMESETMRAQTPPLAGEWAVSKGTNVESKSFKQSNMAVASNMTAVNNSKNEMNGFSMTSGSKATSMSSSFKSQSMSSSQMQSSSAMISSSSSFKSSSASFTSGSVRSQTFEAFPGMGGIENLNLEGEKAGK